MASPHLQLSGDPDADALLSRDPLALLIGMVLDQQIPLEWAFRGPLEMSRRLEGRGATDGRGKLDAAAIVEVGEPELVAAFAAKPALHRYPSSMAARVFALCQLVAEQYGNDATAIWTGAADGRDLLRRVKALPGFGEQKARIFVALLGKQLGVKPRGWQAAASPFGEPGSLLSVADIIDDQSLARVRQHKQEMKAAARAAKAKAKGTATAASA